MFTTRCETGEEWDGLGQCHKEGALLPWNNGTNSWLDSSIPNDDFIHGETLSSALNTADSEAVAGIQPHQAAQACENLSMHGHNDWYLPALDELNVLYAGKDAIGGFSALTPIYWTSSEYGIAWAQRKVFSSGAQGIAAKTAEHRPRCVRKAP